MHHEAVDGTDRTPGALMRRMVDVFNTGDLSDLERLIAHGYVDHQGLRGVKVFGPEGFATVVTLARRRRPRLRVEIEELAVDGDTVTARLMWTEPEVGERSGGAPDPPRRTVEVVRFSGGLAVEHWGERLS